MAGFGGSVKLTGESEYRKALQNIKMSLKEVSSEMKLASAQFQASNRDTTALTQKSVDLAKKLELQKKALTDLKSSYAQMLQQYDAQVKKTNELEKSLNSEKLKLDEIKNTLGTSSSAYQQQLKVVENLEKEYTQSVSAQENMNKSLSTMRTQINNTETTIVKTENSLEAMNKALEETDDDAENAGKGLDKAGDSADNAGKKFSGLTNIAKGALKGLGVALAAAGAAMVAIGKQAVKAYANYEQLTGGVSTLFGTNEMTIEEYARSVGKSVDEVKEKYKQLEKAQADVLSNASKAYKTAGMDANTYMETVTSFSAALITSLNGNTEAAAKAANQAIIDMADNANKMGTDIQSIQNAYQGFAKQNYTMLDNLKLGYGGTKTEMERLLEDAEKFSGVKYDLNNLSDVYSAIHIIQNELNITGATANEAEKTISGSAASMKAAWQNLLTGMADDGASFNDLIGQFVDSVVTFSNNITPKITQVIQGIGKLANGLIKETLPQLLAEIPPIIKEAVPMIVDTVSSTISAISSVLPDLVNVLVDIIPQALNSILSLAPEFLTIGISIVNNIVSGVISMLPQIAQTFSNFIADFIPQLVLIITNGLPQILQGAISLLMGIVQAIPIIIEKLTPELSNIITGIVKVLSNSVTQITQGAIVLLNGIIEAIPVILETLLPELPIIVTEICKALVELAPQLGQASFDLFFALVESLGKVTLQLVKMLPQILKSFKDTLLAPLKVAFDKLWSEIKNTFNSMPAWFKNIASNTWNAVKAIFSTWIGFFENLWSKIKGTFSDLGTSIAGAIGGAVKAGINGVITMIQNTINNAIRIINGAISLINKIPNVNVNKISELTLPRLAKGAIVDKPTNVIVGEDGREAIIPLENNKEWIKQLASDINTNMLAANIKEAQTPIKQMSMYNEYVRVFKDALGQMQVVLDDERMGAFVEKTVINAIY